MAERIEVLHASGGNRLAVIGIGIDYPGSRSLKDYSTGIYQGLNLSGSQPDWLPVGSLERASLRALDIGRWTSSIETGVLSVGPASETSTVRRLCDESYQDYSGFSEPLPAMLVQASEWLESHTVQAVLIAGCNLNDQTGIAAPGFGFDVAIHHCLSGSGAAAVLVMRLAEAQRRKIRVQAVIDVMAYPARTLANSADTIQTCAVTALRTAGVTASQIGILEVLASGDDRLDEMEIRGLTGAYRSQELETAIGSSQVNTGWLDGANGIAALVRAVVCLEQQIRIGIPNWSGPKYPEMWNGSSFYVPTTSLTWFRPGGIGSRRAGVNILGQDGTCAHLILSQLETENPAEPIMREAGLTLLPVNGNTASEIITKIQSLKASLENGESLERLGKLAYPEHNGGPKGTTAVILAHTAGEALREMDFAIRGLPAAAEKGSEWLTPVGSCYTPQPLGPGSQVAFVYPGAFNSYLGVGKDLFYLFPDLQSRFTNTAHDLGTVLCEEQLYPRSLAPLTKEQIDRLESGLLDDAFTMMANGLSVSVALTTIMRDIFNLTPGSAFGYSLGENSMLFALGVWGDGDHLGVRLRTSPLFQSRLSGPQNAVREHWGMQPVTSSEGWGELWGNFLLMAPLERVEQAISSEQHVYLTHINTPRQVVIAGDPAACRRVIEALKCSSLRAPFNYVLHCKAMETEYQSLYDLHTWPVRQAQAVKMYSAADDRPFELSESGIARAVAHDLCTRLDFPRLVETVYNDGARIFIELGAGSNCAKWIEDSLRGRPFLSVSANRKGVDDATAILRVLARLVSHQVPVNLAPLFIDR